MDDDAIVEGGFQVLEFIGRLGLATEAGLKTPLYVRVITST
jgi:hypothetical protein